MGGIVAGLGKMIVGGLAIFGIGGAASGVNHMVNGAPQRAANHALETGAEIESAASGVNNFMDQWFAGNANWQNIQGFLAGFLGMIGDLIPGRDWFERTGEQMNESHLRRKNELEDTSEAYSMRDNAVGDTNRTTGDGRDGSGAPGGDDARHTAGSLNPHSGTFTGKWTTGDTVGTVSGIAIGLATTGSFTATGATWGAAAGSIVPGPGTLVGGVIGGAVGFIAGAGVSLGAGELISYGTDWALGLFGRDGDNNNQREAAAPSGGERQVASADAGASVRPTRDFDASASPGYVQTASLDMGSMFTSAVGSGYSSSSPSSSQGYSAAFAQAGATPGASISRRARQHAPDGPQAALA